MLLIVQDPVCHRNGHDGIIRIFHRIILKVYILGFVRIELIDATYNVTNNSPYQQGIILDFGLPVIVPFSCLYISVINTLIPSSECVRCLSPPPMTKAVIKKCFHGNWNAIVCTEITKPFSNIVKSFIQKIVVFVEVESDPTFLIHMSDMCAAILWYILSIIEAMCHVWCYNDVIELLW